MNLLQQLAEHDREREAPSRVEARLVAAFRARRLRRRVRWLALGAAAAGIAAGILLAPRLVPDAAQLEIRVAPPGAPVIEARRAVTQLAASARPVARQPVAAPAPREVVTEFFPLMDPAPPFERGELLRVNVPALAMREVGLPVREEHLADRVQADVLVGEEGMPRAIRFVSFETK